MAPAVAALGRQPQPAPAGASAAAAAPPQGTSVSAAVTAGLARLGSLSAAPPAAPPPQPAHMAKHPDAALAAAAGPAGAGRAQHQSNATAGAGPGGPVEGGEATLEPGFVEEASEGGLRMWRRLFGMAREDESLATDKFKLHSQQHRRKVTHKAATAGGHAHLHAPRQRLQVAGRVR